MTRSSFHQNYEKHSSFTLVISLREAVDLIEDSSEDYINM